MQSPDMWFVRDTDGDGKADWKERIVHGLDAADSHHETNSICYEPGGAVYFSDGVFHRTNVETLNGPVRNVERRDLSLRAAHRQVRPLRALRLRQSARPRLRLLGQRHHHRRHRQRELLRPGLQRPSRQRRAPGDEAVLEPPVAPVPRHEHPQQPPLSRTTGRAQFLNTNVIGFQGIFRAKITEDGSGLKGETIEPLSMAS